jgi:2'-5' RNA ligase
MAWCGLSRMPTEAVSAVRLFFALWPDQAVREQIIAATQSAVDAAGGRLIPPENYHPTLAFLGSVSALNFPAVRRAGRVTGFSTFTLTLARTGHWPQSRTVWLGPPACPEPLRALVAGLWEPLAAMGLSAANAGYKPHLSLARKVPGGLGESLAAAHRVAGDGIRAGALRHFTRGFCLHGAGAFPRS